jgi:16S rRNA (cytosine967-C5)-methyltransferase
MVINFNLKDNKGQAARKLAISVLLKSSQQGIFVNKLLDRALEESTLSQRDRSFVTALVFGVLKNQASIDKEIKNLSKRPLNKLPPFILVLLRVAFFQLDFMTDIPPFAIVFTSTELAKQETHRGLASYVNGLLRQYLRNKKVDLQKGTEIANEDKEKNLTSSELSVSYSIPEWLIARWLNNYSYSRTVIMLDFFQKPPALVIRTNTQKISKEDLIELFITKEITTRQGQLLEDCLIVETSSTRHSKQDRRKLFKGNPKNLPGYKDGLYLIQDEASAFVAKVLAPQSTDFVIDLCAAPGNKTLYMAELMNGRGRILAIDKDKDRLNYLKEKCLELALENIEIVESDARTLQLEHKADKLLLDAPCTGTGVLHRRQDLRHKKQFDDISNLVALQRQLLSAAVDLIKPGGALVYSTCSIEPEENIENIEWFLARHSEFKADDISSYIPEDTLKLWLENLTTLEEKERFIYQLRHGILQLLPFLHGLSGFFIARLVKNK